MKRLIKKSKSENDNGITEDLVFIEINDTDPNACNSDKNIYDKWQDFSESTQKQLNKI